MTDASRLPIGRADLDASEAVGVAAMLLLVGGSTLPEGLLLQKLLFLVAPVVLLAVAHVNDERMLEALEVVILAGSAMAFLPWLGLPVRLAVLGGLAALSVGYLVRIDYREQDRFWPIGGLGLVLLAAGFAVSDANLLAFNALLSVGSLVAGIYATLAFLVLGIRIQAIWIVLNVAFAITPGLRVVRMLT